MKHFSKATVLDLILSEFPVVLTNGVESYLMVIFGDEFSYASGKVLFVDYVLFPDVEDMLSSSYVVQAVDIFSNFHDNVLDLCLIVLPFFLLLNQILTLNFAYIYFAIFNLHNLLFFNLLTLQFLLDHLLLFLF